MKRTVLVSMLLGALPLSMVAQDDLYFIPSKKDVKATTAEKQVQEEPAYYIGSDRDVDEYNRRVKQTGYYQLVEDSLGKDTLYLFPGDDRLYSDDDDFTYSRRMGRFDGFYGWYDPWFYGYWGSPWYRHWGWDPWYSSWGGYYGWYDPWYYGWYGYWGYPYRHWGYWGYYGGGPAVILNGHHGYAGTRNHSQGGRSFGSANFGGSRYGSFGNSRNVTRKANSHVNTNTNSNSGRFGGSRAPITTTTRTSSNTNSFGGFGGSNHSGGSFGGSRGSGGGGSFGGSRGGGGGHFGGSRR